MNIPSKGGDEQSSKPKNTIKREERLKALDGVEEKLTALEDIQDWTRYMAGFILQSQYLLEIYEKNPNPHSRNNEHYWKLDHDWETGMRALENIAHRVRTGEAKKPYEPKTQTQTQREKS